MQLTTEERGVLLAAARESIQTLFAKKNPPVIDFKKFSNLKQNAGAFVTLTINGHLRGCIGYLSSQKNIFETVCDAAVQAASNDPRFPPLTREEVGKVNIEISVLSPPNPIRSYEDIEIGRHGLILDEGYRRGVLLPQVARENNYSIPQFLTAICEKTGIDSFTWEHKPLNLYTFTAVVFSELGRRRRTYEPL
jgi:AmmeMemoRadiSam system protein A